MTLLISFEKWQKKGKFDVPSENELDPENPSKSVLLDHESTDDRA